MDAEYLVVCLVHDFNVCPITGNDPLSSRPPNAWMKELFPVPVPPMMAMTGRE
jgi:hypothetical protein